MDGLIDRPADLAPHPGDPGRVEAFIPTPCVQNHAAFIAPLPGGALGCAWFGGTQEGIPDISVWFSRLAPGATRWAEPVRLSDDPTRSEQNPLLFATPAGALWLLWTAQLGGNQDTALIRRRISADGGATWGPIEDIIPETPGYGTFIRSRIVVNASGEWLLPIWRCTKPAAGAWTGDLDTSSVLLSADAGATWRECPVPDSTGCVHMSIIPWPAPGQDRLLAFYRSRWADHVYRSESPDGGRSWTAPRPTSLPNNNSSVMALTLASGAIALMYNASSAADASGRRASLYDDIGGEEPAAPPAEGRAAFWGAPRAPMTIALSEDGGLTWPWRRDLETGDGYCMTNNSKDRLNREFSYPSLCQTPDGALHLAYTYWRQAIKYVRVTEAWIRA
ncbi:sialidase family protein [Paracraurococcus ruber]|uniref:Glycosyl hydrolase n=1 Tax=Paracraurococcus ruber TaxID=77675 RepID=A0ABS1CXQ6_9PROT|nr:exo-alpha-sialidase [Paracraurococcus ruber]MBK1659321.1 glycosyl hydrolase [Paracraurococcus ruber]TDG29804.1 glycosyl hydrolase [Paracraurococcus ruber]